MSIAIWMLLLVCQNAAFTWVSRARNSGSYAYHAIAAVFSNGVFFVTQFFMIGFVAAGHADRQHLAQLTACYIAATVTGSLLMHWISLRFLERGNRRVGA